MHDLNIKNIVKDRTATFMYYKKGALWYTTEDSFEFPVPVSDVGDGIFNSTEKAMTLMRYVRLHVEAIKAGKAFN